MIARLQKRGLHLSAWVNPYIAQRSAIFAEGLAHDYFVKRPDGTVWQWDMWQAGMALVDFTNPAAKAWYQDKIRTLLKQGIHAIKTDIDQKSTRLNSSHVAISYAVFCLKKKKRH